MKGSIRKREFYQVFVRPSRPVNSDPDFCLPIKLFNTHLCLEILLKVSKIVLQELITIFHIIFDAYKYDVFHMNFYTIFSKKTPR